MSTMHWISTTNSYFIEAETNTMYMVEVDTNTDTCCFGENSVVVKPTRSVAYLYVYNKAAWIYCNDDSYINLVFLYTPWTHNWLNPPCPIYVVKGIIYDIGELPSN